MTTSWGALPFLPTFPFPDGVEKIAQGGSVNLFLSVDLQIGNTLSGLGVGQGEPEYRQPKFGNPKPVVDPPSNPYYNGNGPRPGVADSVTAADRSDPAAGSRCRRPSRHNSG